VSFRGSVVNIVDVKLLGFIKISPKSKTEPFKLLGESSLKVFNREVVAGLFELTRDELVINGMFDLFPEGFPIVLKGHIIAYMSKRKFLLDSGIHFSLGPLTALARIYIHAEDPIQDAKSRTFIRDEFNVDVEDNINVLFIKLVFLNSELNVSVVTKTDHATQASLDVVLQMTALRLIDFSGTFNITVNERSGLTMQGQSRLIVGPRKKPLIRSEAFLIANLDPARGYFGIQSDVSLYFSFLSSEVRLTGMTDDVDSLKLFGLMTQSIVCSFCLLKSFKTPPAATIFKSSSSFPSSFFLSGKNSFLNFSHSYGMGFSYLPLPKLMGIDSLQT